MRFLKGVLICTVVAFVLCGVVLPENADKIRVMDGLGKAVFAVFGVVLVSYVWRFRRWLKTPERPPAPPRRRLGKPILVDGSNVMHWAGNEPSALVLTRVIAELRGRGYEPIIYFDANFGYKLWNKHVDPDKIAQLLGVPEDDVVVAPSGTPADPILLERASSEGWRVLTNDRFIDWKNQFPKLNDRGFLVKGRWQEGSVILLGLGR